MVAGIAAAALLVVPAGAADDDLELASRATGPAGAAADAGSSRVSISADGRRVAFRSEANNLSAEDDNGLVNIFVRDLAAGTTALVSRASGAAGPAANGGSLGARVAVDGLSVAFSSGATNLSPDHTDGTEAIYLRRLDTLETALVSRAGGATDPSIDGSAFGPAPSADGRLVAFEGTASNVTPDATLAVTNIWMRDLVARTTTLVSRAGGPGGAQGNAGSIQASVSADGRYVAFASMATNLSGDDGDATQDIFVRDRLTDSTILATRATGAAGAAADAGAGAPALSADGRYVTFSSIANNLSAEDADGTTDVFVRDLVANTTTLASRAPGAAGAAGDGDSGISTLSADGRLVAFASVADNLSIEDDDALRDVFVRDLLAGTTRLVSRSPGPSGAAATGGDSGFPAIASGGRHVVFESDADNLASDDQNAVTNIFVRTLPPPASLAGPGAAGGGVTPRGGATAVARCAGQRATIVGTARRNVIRGTAKRDVIAALAGNDLVRGLGGNDLICLGAGADRALGGPGADRILGGPGPDVLLGGPGADRLLGQAGRDRALGGLGRDRCPVEAKTGC